MESIHEKIKKLRTLRNISQSQMAKIVGITRATYVFIENGKTQNISIEVGKGIARALDVPFTELFEIEASDSKIIELQTIIKDLKETIKGNHNTIKDCTNRIVEKNLVIDTLTANRKFLVTSLIKYIEQQPSNAVYWHAKQGYRYVKTTKEREYIDRLILEIEKQREGIYDYFLNEGMITNEDIEQAQKIIEKSYNNMNFEYAFSNQFKNL